MKTEIREFHDLKSIEETVKIIHENISPGTTGTEKVRLSDALHRVLAEDICSPVDVPPFDRSQMDGYAVVAEDTYGADEENPVELKLNSETIHAGHDPETAIKNSHASRIATGAPIPRGANAVVMVEYCNEKGASVSISKPVHPGENIMHAGEDIMRGEIVLRSHTHLGFRETAVLSALGITSVDVFKKPRVAVISTGNEIFEPGKPLSSGKIYDINSRMIIDAAREDGASPEFLGISSDDENELLPLLEKALSYDMVIITGGTSAGQGDVSYRILKKRLDPGILVHGVAIKPGKPVVIAANGKKPVFVLPGFPSSAIVTYSVFVKPLVRSMAGLPVSDAMKIEAISAVRYQSAPGRHEFVLSNIVKGDDGAHYVYPVTKSSGAVTSFSLADGYVEIPPEQEYIEKGEAVEVKLLSDNLHIPDLVFIGSQCMGVDIALGILSRRGCTSRVINVGSTGGLIAAKRGEPDISGIHILDKKTGAYNTPFMDRGLILVRGYRRKQGIIFRSDCSRKSFDEFVSDRRLSFINRTAGSGTRILFDMIFDDHARRKGASSDILRKEINGYNIESKSHNSVAAAIASGKADWGVGIESAARMYSLGFIPLRDEEYDFCVPEKRFKKKCVQEFISVLKSTEFKKKLESLGGFVVPKDIGKVVYDSSIGHTGNI